MEIYLLKSTIAISVLYAFYWLLLRNETYFGWNRVYLISSIIISLVSPLLHIPLFENAGEAINNVIQPAVISAQNNLIRQENSLSILSIIYISGAVFFTLKFLSKLSQIYYLFHRFPKVKYNGFRAVLVDGDLSPFTFFSILFLSRSDYEKGNITEMIIHESTHKEQLHSLDVLLLEFITIIQWFNPFLWLIRIALKAEHEFIADSKVLEKGYDRVAYQTLLFEKSLGVTGLGVTSNFNYSLLKNRLKMMTMKKSGSRAIVKYLFSLPLLLSICLFLSANLKVLGQEKVYYEVEKMPQYGNNDANDLNGVRLFVNQNLKYPESAAKLGVQGRVYVQFVVSDKGKVIDVKISRTDFLEMDKSGKIVYKELTPTGDAKIDQAYKDLENESVRVVKLLGDFTPGEKDGEKVNVGFTFPITYVLH